MNFFKRMPPAAEEARRRANALRAVGENIHARSLPSKPSKGGVWQALLAILERTDAAQQTAAEAKAEAEKANRPVRAEALKLIQSRRSTQ